MTGAGEQDQTGLGSPVEPPAEVPETGVDEREEPKKKWPSTSKEPSVRSGLFVVDLGQIQDALTKHLVRSERSSGLAAIVFADGQKGFTVAEFQPLVQLWNYRLEDRVGFFFVGYVGDEDRGDSEFVTVLRESVFHAEAFNNAIEELQRDSGWDYRGDLSLILCRAHLLYHKKTGAPRAFLDFDSLIEFDLERALGDRLVDSVNSLFETVTIAAKEIPGERVDWKLSAVLDRDSLGDVLIETVGAHLPGPKPKPFADVVRFLSAKKG